MRTLDSTFKAQKNATTNKLIHLFTVHDYDGLSTNLTYTDYTADVTYPASGGVTYTKFPIQYENITENSKGEIDTVRLTVGNASRVIEAYLTTYDLRGKQVTIRTVFADQLADTDAYIDDIYFIDSYTADEESVQFSLSSKFDVLDIQLPGRTFLRNYCQWKFKSTECGYAGGETACNKTLARCRVLANQVRFGGFPSIPSDRLFIG